MAVDKGKVRRVVEALHNEILTDKDVREQFIKNPVKVLASRDLNMDEIIDVYDDPQACVGITCVGITCIALSILG
jgi:hypothetical protein